MKNNLKSTLTLSALQVKNIYSQTELSGGSPPFFNRCFDKNRIKLLVSWSLKNCGQKMTIDLIENLKNLGFRYATEAGISLGIDDLRIPSTKNILLVTAEKNLKKTNINSKQEYLTGIEKFQHLIDTWHKTSEILKQDVIANFQLTDVFNPVYMMAFSGARGNVSQVRQLVGMRGLMSDPQGQILDFPIKSNFREGITLTEYIISCYGARKGLVDTALKTANSGYLTRRLVDVCHHIIVCDLDCKTKRGVFISDIFENRKIIVPLQNRLVGRILAEDIYGESKSSILTHPQVEKEENILQIKFALFFSLVAKDNFRQHVRNKPDIFAPSIPINQELNYATFDLGYVVNDKQFLLFLNTLLRYKPKFIAKRNQEISVELAKKIARLKKSVFVRSPLTCKIKNSICQLCYGWSLAHGKLVSLGEAVGVVAAQSIGEPGTQLTMRTFHTGGVFSGDVMNEIVAPFSGKIIFDDFFPGMLIRTPHGKIAFLTKAPGSFKLTGSFLGSVKPHPKREKSTIFQIPALCVLFVRNQEYVTKGQSLAEFSLMEADANQRIQASHNLNSEIEGEVLFKSLLLLTLRDGKTNKIISRTTCRLGCIWILAGKICMQSVPIALFSQPGDLVDKSSILAQYETMSSHSGFISKHEVNSGKNTNSVGHLTQPYNPPYSSGVGTTSPQGGSTDLGFMQSRKLRVGETSLLPPLGGRSYRPLAYPFGVGNGPEGGCFARGRYDLPPRGVRGVQSIKHGALMFYDKNSSKLQPCFVKQTKQPQIWDNQKRSIKNWLEYSLLSYSVESFQYKGIGYFFALFLSKEVPSVCESFSCESGPTLNADWGTTPPLLGVDKTSPLATPKGQARGSTDLGFMQSRKLRKPVPLSLSGKNRRFFPLKACFAKGKPSSLPSEATSLSRPLAKRPPSGPFQAKKKVRKTFDFATSNLLDHLKRKDFQLNAHKCFLGNSRNHEFKNSRYLNKKFFFKVFPQQYETQTGGQLIYDNFYLKKKTGEIFWVPQETHFVPVANSSTNSRNYLIKTPKNTRFLAKQPRERPIYSTQRFFSRSRLNKSKIFLGSRKPHPKRKNMPARSVFLQLTFLTTNKVPKRVKFYALHETKSNLSIPLPTQIKRGKVFCYAENKTHKKQKQFFLSGSFPVTVRVQGKKYAWKNLSKESNNKVFSLRKTKQNDKKVTRTRNPLFIFGLRFLLGMKIRNGSFFLDFDKNGSQGTKKSSLSVSKNLIHKIKLFKAHNVSYKLKKTFQKSKIYSFDYKFYQTHFNVNPLAKISNTSQPPLDENLYKFARSRFAQVTNPINSPKREKLEHGPNGGCFARVSPVFGKVDKLSGSYFARKVSPTLSFMRSIKLRSVDPCFAKEIFFCDRKNVCSEKSLHFATVKKNSTVDIKLLTKQRLTFLQPHFPWKVFIESHKKIRKSLKSCFFFNEKEKKVLYHVYLNSLVKYNAADFSSPSNESKKSKIFFITSSKKLSFLTSSAFSGCFPNEATVAKQPPLGPFGAIWGEVVPTLSFMQSIKPRSVDPRSKPSGLPNEATRRAFLAFGFMQSIKLRAKRENQLKDFLIKATSVPKKSETNWKGIKRQLNHLKMSNTKQQPAKQVEKRKLKNSSYIKTKIKAGWMYLPSLGQIKNRQVNSSVELASQPSQATTVGSTSLGFMQSIKFRGRQDLPPRGEFGLSNNSLEQAETVLCQADTTPNTKNNQISAISSSSVHKKHDKILKPGVICFDTILFDQYPVYCQCISMSAISLSDAKSLKKKNIDLVKFKELLQEFQYTKRSYAVRFSRNSFYLTKQGQNNKSIGSSNNNDERFAAFPNFAKKLAGSDNSLYLQITTVKKWFFNIFSLKLRSSLLFQRRFAICQLYRTKKIYKNRFNLVIKRILVKTILTENSLTQNLEKIYFLKNINFTAFRCTLSKSNSSHQGPLLFKFSSKHGIVEPHSKWFAQATWGRRNCDPTLQSEKLPVFEPPSLPLRGRQGRDPADPSQSNPKGSQKPRTCFARPNREKPEQGRCNSVPNYFAKQKNRQATPFYQPIFLRISKVKSYSFQTVTQYKRLLAQQNKVPTGDVTSFISSPLGPLKGQYGLPGEATRKSCFASAALLGKFYRTQQKTKKPLSGNFLLHSVLKLRLINKQNSTHLFRHYPSPDFYLKFFFKFPFYPRTFGENESNGLIKNIFSKKTSIVQYNIIFIIPKNYKNTTTKIYFPAETKQRVFGIENKGLEDPYSRFYAHQLAGKTYSNLSSNFNVSIFSELETVSLAQHPRELPKKSVAVAHFTPKHLSNDNETLTKIFSCSQNYISLEMPMKYTNLLSRHYGEILYSGFDRNKGNSSVKKKNRDSALLLDTTEKQKYLTLTSDEQTTFAVENSDSKLEVPSSCQDKPEKQRNTKSRYTLGDRISYGAKLSRNLVIPASGVIIQITKSIITVRKAQPLSFSAKGLVSVYQGDIIEKNTLIMRLFYQRLKTGDIVQGIPRIEQLFEARKTNQGELLSGSLHEQLEKIFLYYLDTYNFSKAARYSLEKIQQIIVSSVQKVYRSQGVIIADKHLEIIIRQMTSKVEVIESGQTSLLPGEIVDLDWIEVVNKGMNDENTKAKYVPIILGITRKSLETKSFISEASFQETTRVLTKSSIERRTDFLKGLKENVILGHLVPAGTGFYSNTALHKKMFPPIKPPYHETRVYESYNIFRKIFSPLLLTPEEVLDEKID